jgi:hypothetical protein
MSGKASRLNTCLEKISRLKIGKKRSIPEPLLVVAYRQAMERICGVKPYVAQAKWPSFYTRMRTLDEEGVEYGEYANAVITTWIDWCREKGMTTVPANIFTGDAAFDRYMVRVHDSKNVSIDTPAELEEFIRVQDELTVARLYIDVNVHGVPCTWNQACDACWRMLAFVPKDDAPGRLTPQVLELLNACYGLQAASYDDIITAMRSGNGPAK